MTVQGLKGPVQAQAGPSGPAWMTGPDSSEAGLGVWCFHIQWEHHSLLLGGGSHPTVMVGSTGSIPVRRKNIGASFR